VKELFSAISITVPTRQRCRLSTGGSVMGLALASCAPRRRATVRVSFASNPVSRCPWPFRTASGAQPTARCSRRVTTAGEAGPSSARLGGPKRHDLVLSTAQLVVAQRNPRDSTSGRRATAHARRAEHTRPPRVPPVSSFSFAFQPSWSPDGTKFVFALFAQRRPGTGQEGIYTADADGSASSR
jgi:hypothetical protein